MPEGLLSFCGALVGSALALGGNLFIERGKRIEAAKKCRNTLRVQFAILRSTADFVAKDPFLDGIIRLEDQLKVLRSTIAENRFDWALQERVTLAQVHGEQSVARLKSMYSGYVAQTQGDDENNRGREIENIYDRLVAEAKQLSMDFNDVCKALRDSPSVWDVFKL